MFALLAVLAGSSHLFLPNGTLRAGSRVEVVQVETGWCETREIGDGSGEAAGFEPPSGTFIVSVFEPNGAARGFMRLSAKRGGETPIGVPITPARGRGQVSLELSFPKDATPDAKDVALLLAGRGKKLLPDVLVFTGAARARAFWLDVPAGPAAVTLTSREWTLTGPLGPVVPERGALALRGELVPKPSLRLRFDVAESAPPGPVEVDLLNCEKERHFSGPTPIERCVPVSSQKGRSDAELFFGGLDPALFACRWKLGRWTDTVMVDLEDARAVLKQIAIRPFEVAGRITAGGVATGATLRFWAVNTSHTFETQAAEDGLYRISLVRRGWYRVGIRRPGLEAFGADLKLEGDEPRDEHADFDVPANRVTVRIFDAKTSEPIAGAMAFVEDGRGNSSEITDASGTAVLSPLPKGSYAITGSAKGYRSSKPVRFDVDESTRERDVGIRLLPSAEIRLRVLDTPGDPLVGASVGAMEGQNPISGGLTDSNGIATLPDPFPPGQPLVAWDAAGRIGVFRWSGEEQQELVIPPSAPPILVRFVSARGEPRARWAPAFSIDGVAIPLVLNRFENSGGDTNSRADGTFRLAGLPASGVLILWPFGMPELAVTRPLPLAEEITFTVPAR